MPRVKSFPVLKKKQMTVFQLTTTDTLIYDEFGLYFISTEDGRVEFSTKEMIEVYGEDILDKIFKAKKEVENDSKN